jgi:lysylphosphatidylglycerol synthetase-like protein (DUF2156 family)
MDHRMNPLYVFVIAGKFLRPLVVAACVAIVTAIPVAAARRRLHIPGYVGIAFAAFVVALLVGKFSGRAGISGTTTGFFLSLLFFFLMATAVGSVVALFFYRHPEV